MKPSPSDLLASLRMRDDGAVIAVVSASPARVLEALAETLDAVGTPCRTGSGAVSAPVDLAGLAAAIPGDVLLLHELDAWDAAQWASLDGLRKRLERPGHLILLLTPAALTHLQQSAPHLESWVEEVVELDEAADILTEDQVEERKQAWRAHFGMTDEQLIQRATDGTAPVDPGISEWLALLERGDLIRHG